MCFYHTAFLPVNGKVASCCSKVNQSWVNGNVIMSGWGDDHPDDEGREADSGYTKSVSRGADDGRGGVGAWGFRAPQFQDQGQDERGGSERSHSWQSRPSLQA